MGPLPAPKRLALLALAVVAAVLLGWTVFVVGGLAIDLQQGRSELLAGAQTLQSHFAQLTPAQAVAASEDFRRAEQHFSAARDRLRGSRLIGFLRHVPAIDHQMRATSDLTDMGIHASRTATIVAEAVRRGATVPAGQHKELGQQVLALLDAVTPTLDGISSELRVLATERARLPASGLLPPLSSAIKEFDVRVAPLEQMVAALTADGPGIRYLLGEPGPHTYLVLQQDPAELRGTGGFIGSVGLLTIDHGKLAPYDGHAIEDLDFKDNKSVLGPPGTKSHVDAPFPLDAIFHVQSWELRDSNWSPDFPTAAQQAEFFLQRQTGRNVKGIIAIDPFLVSKILAITGPVRLPETGDTITTSNFFALTLERVQAHPELGGARKDFLSFAAKAILSRMFSLPPQKWALVLAAFQQACDERSLQAYFRNADARSLVDRHSCGGQVRPPTDDGLMVVDSNVGGAKYDFWLKRRFSLDVQIRPDGSIRHTLHLRYSGLESHPPLTGIWGYTGWLRLYLGPSSSLVSVSGAKLERASELGRPLLQGWLYVQFGADVDVTVVYDSPGRAGSAGSRRYEFFWQKQAGRQQDPISLRITLPPGSTMRSESLGSKPLTGDSVTTDLRVDRHFVFEY
jgi:uncharacterized protein DUF4012